MALMNPDYTDYVTDNRDTAYTDYVTDNPNINES